MHNDYFEIFLADTQESKDINYSIRYQVYCEEMGFENKDDYPSKMEFDENDDDGKSVHFIAKNKITGQWVGAMRLIFKQDDLLPIEQTCKLEEKVRKNNVYGAVELSRLCLVKDIRRRFKDIDPPHGITDDLDKQQENDKVLLMPNHQKISQMVLWGLLYAAVDYGYSNKIMTSYFMTTAALAKVLKRRGLNLTKLGDSLQHKGERYPFRMDTSDVYHKNVWKESGFSGGYGLFSRSSESQLISAA